MRQLLAVAFLGMSLAFTASAAFAADQEIRLPSQGQQQEAVMVSAASGSPAAVDTDQPSWLAVRDINDK